MDQEVAKQAHQSLFELSVWYAKVYVSHNFSAPAYELPSITPTIIIHPSLVDRRK
jgi:hypothetical protein